MCDGAREGEMVHERRCEKNTARVVVTLDGDHVRILRDILNEIEYKLLQSRSAKRTKPVFVDSSDGFHVFAKQQIYLFERSSITERRHLKYQLITKLFLRDRAKKRALTIRKTWRST